jgi:signal transduction histidine kinase
MDEVGRLAKTFNTMMARLHRSQESQRRFVENVSHDLRGPLAVLRANLDLLDRDLTEEDRHESVTAMRTEIQRMTKIVDDLLLLAEMQTALTQYQEPVPLERIVVGAVSEARQYAAGREISVERLEDVLVQGDPERLRRVVANLLDNAIKYTSNEGRITVSLYTEAGRANLEVEDDGIGIEPPDLPHVFDRFFRADRARARDKGAGLGLAIVRTIVEQHGGDVTVESQPGKGSRFTVRLGQ